MNTKEGLRVVKLTATNVKNLRAILIPAKGNSVILTGANAVGKSAVLDLLAAAFTGGKLKDPIRHGQNKAEATIDLGSLIIKRKWTGKTDKLELTTPEGAVYKSPQKELNKLYASISFDPMAVSKMTPKERVSLLRKLLKVDFTELDSSYQKIYDERTMSNRLNSDAEARLSEMEEPDADVPEKMVSVGDELKKVGDLREVRQKFLDAIAEKEDLQHGIDENVALVESWKERIEEAETAMEELHAMRHTMAEQKAAVVVPEMVTVEEINEATLDISRIEDTNETVRAATRYRSLIKEITKSKAQSKEMTRALRDIEQKKKDMIANCKMPIKGLSFAEGDLRFGKNLFTNLSKGEKIQVSCAIGMALNPDLRVLTIEEGETLDDAGIEAIMQLAGDKGYQLWVHRTTGKGKLSINIQEGK